MAGHYYEGPFRNMIQKLMGQERPEYQSQIEGLGHGGPPQSQWHESQTRPTQPTQMTQLTQPSRGTGQPSNIPPVEKSVPYWSAALFGTTPENKDDTFLQRFTGSGDYYRGQQRRMEDRAKVRGAEPLAEWGRMVDETVERATRITSPKQVPVPGAARQSLKEYQSGKRPRKSIKGRIRGSIRKP